MLFLDLVREIEKTKDIYRLFEFLCILNYSNYIILVISFFFHFLWVSSLFYLLFLQINRKLQSISSHGSKQKRHFEYFSIQFNLLEGETFLFLRKKIGKSLSRIHSPSHCRNKNIGCSDIEMFGTWSHDLIDIYRNILK